jgi:hypothetical protein
VGVNFHKGTIVLFLSAILSFEGICQQLPPVILNNLKDNQRLTEAIIAIEAEHQLQFFFKEEWLLPFKVKSSQNGLSLQQLLEEIFQDTEFSYTTLSERQIVILKDQSKTIARVNLLTRAATEKKEISSIHIGSYENYVPGSMVRLNGRVIDNKNNLALAGASIQLVPGNQSTATNAEGRYSLQIPAGEYVLSFRYVNYEEKLVDLKIYQDGVVNIDLQETPFFLDEVIISGDPLAERTVGQVSLQMQAIKRAPTFLGEVDIVKQLQIQPGVSTVGEAATGFNVRGGGADQNLILFDGVPVFNISHVLGFFTAFNPDAVSEVSFYRGNIPAEYGGRVASTLNIASREGSFEKWSGKGGIGFISSSITLDGPIKKDTTSLLLSIRGSYSDWMLRSIQSNFQNVRNSSAYFFDGAIKLSHRTKQGNKITFSSYSSNDQFSIANDTTFGWQNLTAVFRYDHRHSEKLFGSYSLGIGRYSYQVTEQDSLRAFKLNYDITYPILRMDYVLDAGVPIAFGLNSTWYNFNPGTLQPNSSASNITRINMPNEQSLETALYVQSGFQLHAKLFLDAGLRYAIYQRFGPGTVYQYRDNEPLEPRNTIDSTLYTSGQIMKTYHGPEPRLSLRFSLSDNKSIKASYNRLYQYIHLVSNTAAIAPVDIWQSSNIYFKPQIADMFSLGYYSETQDRTYESFAEVYYRNTQNILDFKDGADLILNPQLETALLLGLSSAYGVETSISKVKGRLTGNLNYTYARSLRMVDGLFETEKINEGKIYPANFDQPHIANLNWRYGISRRHFFSGGFTYRTGRPMSLPVSGYVVDGILISNFSERNQFRIPDYHRLDLAFILEGNHKRKKLWDGTWIISCYNVYARKNAFSVFFQDDGTGFLRPYRLAIIGTAIPTVTYNFKF